MRLALCTSFAGRAAWYFIEIGGEFDCLRLFQLECCNYMSVVTFSKQKNPGDEKLQVPKHYNKISCRHPGMLSEFFLFGAEGLKAPSTPGKSQNIKQKQRKGRTHKLEHLQRPRVDSDCHNFVIFTCNCNFVTSCCSTSKGRRNEG